MSILAEATRAAHIRLHKSGPFHRIAKGAFCREDVAQALSLHLGCWQALPRTALCQALFGRSQAAFFRLVQFRAELERLGRSAAAAPSPDLPKDLPSEAVVLGAAYVFLGSHKGGRQLARRLAAKGYEGAAQTFLPDEDHDKHWEQLQANLDRTEPSSLGPIIGAADGIFCAFDIGGRRDLENTRSSNAA